MNESPTKMLTLKYAVAPGYEVKAPERKSEGAAGIDVYLPKINEKFIFEFMKMNDKSRASRIHENKLLINPYFSTLIPTGLYFNIPKDTYLDVGTKSGVFKKTGLKIGSHVIDWDYQGQVYISVFSTSRIVVELEEGQAIAQLIHKEYIHSDVEAIPFIGLYGEATARGDNGFGSTDNNGGHFSNGGTH